MTDHERVQEILRLTDQAPRTLDPRKAALLVVDVQRYLTSADYPWAKTLDAPVPGARAGEYSRAVSDLGFWFREDIGDTRSFWSQSERQLANHETVSD